MNKHSPNLLCFFKNFFLQNNWRKYYHGRQNASSFRASIVTGDRVLFATRWSTLTADKVPYAAGWSTMTGDRVLATTAETLRRPTEYFRILRKHRDGRQSARYYRKEYSHDRQNTLCCRMEYYDGRQSTLYNFGNTPTADRVLPHFAQAS